MTWAAAACCSILAVVDVAQQARRGAGEACSLQSALVHHGSWLAADRVLLHPATPHTAGPGEPLHSLCVRMPVARCTASLLTFCDIAHRLQSTQALACTILTCSQTCPAPVCAGAAALGAAERLPGDPQVGQAAARRRVDAGRTAQLQSASRCHGRAGCAGGRHKVLLGPLGRGVMTHLCHVLLGPLRHGMM